MEKDLVKLDKKDKKILYELGLDARRPIKQIAKNVRLSEPTVNYRIKNLIKQGVISGFVTVVRIDAVGMNLYRCIFRLENATAKKEKEIIEHFLGSRNVFRAISIMGGWDLAVDFVVPDTHSLFKTLNEATKEFQENLKNHYTLVIAKSFHFKRKYLYPGQKSTKSICRFGGTNKRKKLDEKDLKILRYISTHGRATNLEIGKNTGISSKTVMKRIKSMEQQGIIQAYSAFIHPMVYGALCKRILLYIYEVSDAETRLFEFSRSEPNVINLEKMIGKCNYELYAECFDKKEFVEFMRKLKDSFGDVLYHYDVLDVNFNYQSNYLSLFE